MSERRLYIICEGQTERESVKKLLAPHLLKLGVCVFSPLIKQSGGGIVKWSQLKEQIEGHLRDAEAYVTTLIDYYGIPASYGYPAWEEAKEIPDPIKRMDRLEEEMHKDVAEELRALFIPYIQLHEFEGLLFSDIVGFDALLSKEEYKKKEISDIIAKHPNPELINKAHRPLPPSA